ncbi:MAG TPA: phosphotransferase [Acidimicrobiia bacterium]|nr:phosphotransferase [Acidimicrobiia bacterium]
MTGLPIPLDVADATPEWLTGALEQEVASVEVLDAHSGTTGRARLGITYTDDDGDGPASVFLKLAPFDERQRRFVDAVGLGLAEARFYRDVAAEVPVRIPAVHHASTDAVGRYVMVIEDLEATGCRLLSPSAPDVADAVASIVHELALLHARYWGDPRLDTDLHWVTEGFRVAFGGGGPFIAKADERFGAQMGPTFRRLAALYVDRAEDIADLLAAGPPTLIHGDPHLGNLFLDGARAGFFDWGMVWRATGMRDVAYVLSNSTPPDVRRAHERDWIRHYLGVLASLGIDLTFDDAWEQYRLLAIYGWSSATSTAAMGSRWQTEDVGQGGMRGATTAIEDLESVDLLEAKLR